MTEKQEGSRGIGIVGVATIVLVVLKLASVEPVAGWPWLAVLLTPIGVVLGVSLAVLAAIAIFGVLGGIWTEAAQWRERKRAQKLDREVDP